ncbi:GNAT family N-acetyltransferase [Sphaerisporangium sp. NPDC005289]|uniref:GNAT family N-acetyltransferase n=1 Tax=Sphaerisporangium sp. NPDC005289 TaxID=3155247 RepID=UPI00339F95DA
MPSLVPAVVVPGSLKRAPQPVLSSENDLVLRPWTAADAPAIVDAFRDPDIQHWHARSVESLAEAEEMIEAYAQGWRAESSAHWAVVTPRGEVLGRVAFRTFDLFWGHAEVAYWTRAAARGRGAATTAVRALTTWAFGIGFHRLYLYHSTLNDASCRLALKAGFALEGTERSSILHPDGWHDMHLHALVNPSHLSQATALPA